MGHSLSHTSPARLAGRARGPRLWAGLLLGALLLGAAALALLWATGAGGPVARRATRALARLGRAVRPPAPPAPPAPLLAAAPAVAAAAVPAAEREVAEPLYAQGLKSGWMDYGWSERTLGEGRAAVVDLSNFGGWILGKPGTQPDFGGLALSVKAAGGVGKLEVLLKTPAGKDLPRVRLGPAHVVEEKGGWSRVWVSMEELNPAREPFDQVVLMGAGGALAPVTIDQVALTRLDPLRAVGGGRVPVGPPRPAALSVDCGAAGRPISPLIYGVAMDFMRMSDPSWTELGATARRWGGNITSRYNWRLGNAWNSGADWFHENLNYSGRADYSWRHFLRETQAAGLQAAVVVPTIGWVAKDTESVAFPTSRFPAQRRTDPQRPHAGDGHSPDGKPLRPGPQTLTSVEAPPEFVAEWVSTIRREAGGRRDVAMYILDNEPSIWSTTHRDVRPEPLTYDELLERTVRYGTAVRRADPEALIAGPAEWGWTAYFYSDADVRAGVSLRPDRRAHGDVPLIPWFLREVRKHEERTGTRLLDVLDLHYYPQGQGLFDNHVDRDASLRRLRATRSLWDPTYKDESWVDDTVRLIPRMQEWVRDNAPGLGTMLGEYKFGAERHMSGGLAQAEALGRFGQHGLTAAFYWESPARHSPVYWAFRAYRNYDGAGGRFQDVSLPARSTEHASLFASRDPEGKKLVLVALNLDPDRAADARIELRGCRLAPGAAARTFRYVGEPDGPRPLAAAAAVQKGALAQQLPPWSLTVYELPLAPR
jgi:hypothetical protein